MTGVVLLIISESLIKTWNILHNINWFAGCLTSTDMFFCHLRDVNLASLGRREGKCQRLEVGLP